MPPKLPSKKNWDTYRRWKQYPPTPPAWYTPDVKPKRKRGK